MRLKSQALASLLQQGPESHQAHAALSLATRMLSQCEAQVRILAACPCGPQTACDGLPTWDPCAQWTLNVQWWELGLTCKQATWLQGHSWTVLQATVSIGGT